jgi:uncharacterized membrane protein YqjE
MAADGSSIGVLATLRELVAHSASLLATRGELAALELQDARDRLLRWAALALAAAVLLLAALLSLSIWVAAVFWDGPRELAVGLLLLIYAAAGLLMLRSLRRNIAAAPPLLAQTRAELQKDRDVLQRRAPEADIDAGG